MKADRMPSKRRAPKDAREKILFDRGCTAADLQLISDKSGSSHDHAIAWLHYLGACVEYERGLISEQYSRRADGYIADAIDLPLLDGQTLRLVPGCPQLVGSGGKVADLYGVADDICARFRWPNVSPPRLMEEWDDPAGAGECLDALTAWVAGKLRELEGRDHEPEHSPDFNNIMLELNKAQQSMFRELWEKGNATYERLRELRGSRPVQHDAERKAIDRLADKVTEITNGKVRIEKQAAGVKLVK
jgi:hypothetical protein